MPPPNNLVPISDNNAAAYRLTIDARAPREYSDDHLPGAVELEVDAGSVLIFSEACLHAGNCNPSDKTRVNMYYNYGPSWVQPWEGYRSSPEWVAQMSDVRRQLLGGGRIYSNSEEEARELYR